MRTSHHCEIRGHIAGNEVERKSSTSPRETAACRNNRSLMIPRATEIISVVENYLLKAIVRGKNDLRTRFCCPEHYQEEGPNKLHRRNHFCSLFRRYRTPVTAALAQATTPASLFYYLPLYASGIRMVNVIYWANHRVA